MSVLKIPISLKMNEWYGLENYLQYNNVSRRFNPDINRDVYECVSPSFGRHTVSLSRNPDNTNAIVVLSRRRVASVEQDTKLVGLVHSHYRSIVDDNKRLIGV